MSRRVLAVAGAAALLAVALPALPALAAGEAGTARLVAGADVLPGALQPFKLSVTNTSLSGSVNAVRLTFPPSATGISASLAQPTNDKKFTVTRNATGSSLFFAGGSIPAGGTIELPFNADVAQPAADKAGKFAVTLSQDGGGTGFAATEDTTNGLRSTVRVLEVLATPKPVAPAGVVDGTATGRQALTYGFSVKNHGSAPLSTTAALGKGSSNPSDDTVGSAPATELAANGGTAAFSFPVTLGQADRGDRSSTFIGSASATGAAALAKADTITVQRPSLLTLDAVSPNIVKPGISYSFLGKVTKTGAPALTLEQGSLSFAQTTAALSSTGAFDPAKALSFAQATVKGDGSAASALSPDGDNKSYPVTLSLKVTDGNGFAYDFANTLNGGITLDALAPVLQVAASLPTDADGVRQTAAKNGDRVAVSGSLDRCNDVIDFVELQPNVGTAFKVTVTKGAAGPDGSCSFSGSVTPAAYDPAATSFTVVAQASDLAGNKGGATTGVLGIDNVAPVLSFSQTVSPTRISASFTETNKVLGGCNPAQYKVDGEPLVAQVLYSDGSPCRAGQAGPDNDRILVLSTPKAEEFTSNVAYSPGARPVADPAKDGAGADAAKTVIAVVQGVVPAPPTLVKATRNGGTETAFAETSSGVTSYFTRIAGNDLVLEFAGGRAGYSAVLTNPDGTTKKVSAAASPATITVPLADADGTYGYRLQLLNQSAIPSNPVAFNVVLDRLAPALDKAAPGLAVNGSANSVVATFTEAIVAGTDFAFDWTVEQDSAENGTTSIAVTKVTPTNRTTRTLDTQSPVSAAAPVRAVYELVLSNSKRYQDRAGNTLANAPTK